MQIDIDEWNDSFKRTNRIFVGILLTCGITEIILVNIAHNFLLSDSTFATGTWWIIFEIILFFFSGIVVEYNWFISHKNYLNGYIFLGCIFGLICVTVGFTAANIIGARANIVDLNAGCINPSTSKYFGDSKYSNDILFCESFNISPVTPSTCICIGVEDLRESCSTYEISDYRNHDCSYLFYRNFYSNMLHAIGLFCILPTLLAFSYSIKLCEKGCFIVYINNYHSQLDQVNNPIQNSKSNVVNVSVA